jgi:hypothetical protein
LVAGPITALTDAALDDELPYPECEETGQVVVEVGASTLIKGVAGSTGWSEKV